MAKKNYLFDLPVSFGNVTVGDKTARLAVAVDRGESLTITQADKSICERRLTGRVIAKPPGSQSDQAALKGMDDDITLDGVFDVKGVSFTGDQINFGLTFAIKSIRIEDLAHFAKRAGRVLIESIDEIPEPEKPKKKSGGENGDGAEEVE